MEWLSALKRHSERHPIVVLRFQDEEWESLRESRRGVNEFTTAKAHAQLRNIKTPAPCLILGRSTLIVDAEQELYFGLILSKSPIATLDSRIKVSRAVKIRPQSEAELKSLVIDAPYARRFRKLLREGRQVTVLSPKMSSYIIGRLASIGANAGSLRTVAESLEEPKRYRGNAALQEDAVRTALAAFGLPTGSLAKKVDLAAGRPSALARIGFIEDSVIEHDARSVPGYSLFKSDVTGRALFRNGSDQLEVFTANRRDLEHCLGVDLIYVNLTRKNAVLLQYKMLEPNGKRGDGRDWIYRPDAQLEKEIGRMKVVSTNRAPTRYDYRLNSDLCFLKFVRRDAVLADASIITPLEHFLKIRANPATRGPRGGIRISYNALKGTYLRQTPFLELLKCGYIGSYAHTTKHIQVLLDAILKGDHAVVAAIQQTNAVD